MAGEEPRDADAHAAAVAAVARECIQLAAHHLEALGRHDLPAKMGTSALFGYGWWVRVVRTGSAVVTLGELGFGHEAGSLVRTALHHATALCWLANEPEQAVAAVRYEDELWKHKVAKGARARDWDLGATAEFPKPEHKPAGVSYLKDVERLCDDFGLRNFYIPYRIRSAYVHPSLLSAMSYIELVNGVAKLREAPHTAGVDLKTTAGCVGLATNALWKLTNKQPLRDLADELARRLDIDLTVPVVAAPEQAP